VLLELRAAEGGLTAYITTLAPETAVYREGMFSNHIKRFAFRETLNIV